MSVSNELSPDQTPTKQLSVLLQKAFDLAVNGVTVFETLRDKQNQIYDFRLTMINEAGVRMSGYMRNELIGKTLWEIYPATKINGQFDRYVQVCETGQPYTGEHYYPEYDTWREITITPIPEGILLTYSDITAHKKQAELLQLISNNTPAGLVLWEAVRDDTPQRKVIDFRYQMANRMNAFVTGYPEEMLIGQQLLDLFPRFRGTELEAVLRETIETGKPLHMIFTYYTEKPGGWYDAQFSRVGDGVLMTFMDVSEQHNAQLAQKQQADLLHTILNEQPSGIVLYDPVREQTVDGRPGRIIDFTYSFVNKIELKVTGLTEKALLGQRLLTLFPSREGRALFERMVEVAETGQSKEWQLSYFSDGIQGWFQASLIRHEKQVLFTFLDITKLKKKKNALEQANLELRRSNDNLQQFAYVATHDLQEPLRVIRSFAGLLAVEYKAVLDEKAQDWLTRIIEASKRSTQQIADLLEYSRATTHRNPFEPVSLLDLLSTTLDDLYVAIQESNAILTWDSLPAVVGDKRQLHLLFLNLLSNAIKFRRPGVPPQVQVTYREVAAQHLPVNSFIKDLDAHGPHRIQFYHEFKVADNGIGFDEKYLDKIFQIFQRLHSKKAYPGTGVGLALCRKVIENHQGVITATSQAGVGSTFMIYLPVFTFDHPETKTYTYTTN